MAYLAEYAACAQHVLAVLSKVAFSIFAERITGGYFLDFDIDREKIARYGLTVDDVEDQILAAVGGIAVLETVKGRERYAILLRYAREFREEPEALECVLVPTRSGAQLPLRQLADLRFRTGPDMLRTEEAQFMNSGSVGESLIILLTIPFSLIGAVWPLYWLDYNMSVAIWVGMIALAGLAAKLGVLMMLYLGLAYREREARGKMSTTSDLTEAIVEGAARRLRPKLMTGMALLAGLLPILWSSGTGADVMKRIAAPMVGGIFSAIVLTLIVLPAVYAIWRRPGEGGQRYPREPAM
jgi:Cu/Ag efflux pump CusA